VDYQLRSDAHASEIVICSAEIEVAGKRKRIEGRGNGPIDAFIHALDGEGVKIGVVDYHQDAVGRGSNVQAVCFMRCNDGSGRERFGVGFHANTITASLRAIVSAANRLGLDKPN
jgi:2-isopropylmalate synthase